MIGGEDHHKKLGVVVTFQRVGFIVDALNNAHGTNLDESFYDELGLETLKLEWEFNRQAGFTEADDELPEFFLTEGLLPKGKVQRHTSAEVNKALKEMIA